MADVEATSPDPRVSEAALPAPYSGGFERVQQFLAQPAIKRSLPAIGAGTAILAAGLAYLAIASGPDRILYSSLTDSERASVVEALEQGGIGYAIDSATGMISVSEDELYRARMLVASNTGLAAPQTATDMLDSIPLGASRTLEGERLRLARERELMQTIQEIDGISSVRVHLATPERSVFVRENSPPSASVMVRLTRGRSLSKDQVDAIVNLVAGSVPGLSSDAVRVVDQNGRLLSSESEGALDGLLLQREFEAKLRDQLDKLLVPLLGEGNFSSEVQVELEQAEVTAARESYDREGVVRSESESSATRAAGGQVGGVPGVLANTPPPPAELVEEAPEGNAADGSPAGQDSETSLRRDYDIGREVSVTSTRPGGLSRISVAVAVSAEALEKIAPADEAKITALVEAAVGADTNRGDVVTVITGSFEAPVVEEPPFYETPWFAMALRYGGAVLALLLVLLLGVRPFLKRMKRAGETADQEDDPAALIEGDGPQEFRIEPQGSAQASHDIAGLGDTVPTDLAQQVELARRLAAAQPERAVAALQRMLAPPEEPEASS